MKIMGICLYMLPDWELEIVPEIIVGFLNLGQIYWVGSHMSLCSNPIDGGSTVQEVLNLGNVTENSKLVIMKTH